VWAITLYAVLLCGFMTALLEGPQHVWSSSGLLGSPPDFRVGGKEFTMIQNTSAIGALAVIVCSQAIADGPVQWRVQDGGNGHWYDTHSWSSPIYWKTAQQFAIEHGAELASLTSAEEDQFVTALAAARPSTWNGYWGPWIGASGQSPCSAGSSCFTWMDGTPLAYSRWHPGNPDDILYATSGFVGVCLWDLNGQRAWQDFNQANGPGLAVSAVIEWSADCNQDGVVDYGQILSSQLADANGNGVPDLCESPTCMDADLFRDGQVNGADLGILLSQWGPANPNTVSDINRDRTVDGADLGFLLANWGPCPL
jgi:hypothetical protein